MSFSHLPTVADMQASRKGQPIAKPRPRILDKAEKKRAAAAQERACRKAVDARDHRRCFFPDCKAYASEKHHIQRRSDGGQWITSNILSACREHHALFKAHGITVRGNPERGTVRVWLIVRGQFVRIPRR